LTEEASQATYRLHAGYGRFLRTPLHCPQYCSRISPNWMSYIITTTTGYERSMGATLSKPMEVNLHAECDQIGGFLEVFENVALATSASATLSQSRFCTSRSWNPRHYSLLPFKQLKELVIEFSFQDGCSSSVDDEIITALTQATPKLEILQPGNTPCEAPSNVTVQGLITPTHHCLGLLSFASIFKRIA